MKIYDVLILGAGASGLMCASNIDKKLQVGMVECNSKIAQKLKISGGGKCNITNAQLSQENFDGDKDFIFHVFEQFSRDDLLEYLRQNGVVPELRKKRYYFCKDSSSEIIEIFKKATKDVAMHLSSNILWVKKEGELFHVQTQKESLRAKKVVVATGGKSYKDLGATDIALEIAKSFGIKVKEFTPALVGLTVQKEQFWMRELSGLSCMAAIKVGAKTIKEELLFTHKGISGPSVLSASLYWQKGNIAIDFLPDANISELIKGSKKLLSSLIPLPKRLSKALLEALEVEDTECKKISNESKKKLENIHAYEFAPAGNFGFSKAEVSRGGVLSEELNPYTMEALDVKNLYFIGEAVDVTGELGGYNFQWAFSSGYICAKEINRS
ncbi:MAG: aminoacetone oxidase family FAD-binding enzyme [Sulfurimonas sp.]|uniref:NAD(P)/FAD-dependent oxidoreductase n=1 Tax=Sulfurimonas sp. TaxID=2022749 RepID=UPI0026100C30|nr:aminoacetone oxidase family FAD-binding enzyme [Sulfurimonas sp.]MDD2651774.1 aminoacetone oxidase family FAD-binding enzyme [Sulfurimonas sp.]MDD3451674.1 aminoacetone oxidase family FAD-binding enzyme [Sulfurimonas sp.]